jgi:hypothetical protein
VTVECFAVKSIIRIFKLNNEKAVKPVHENDGYACDGNLESRKHNSDCYDIAMHSAKKKRGAKPNDEVRCRQDILMT